MSCAVIRTRSPERTTAPSITASTFNSRATAGNDFFARVVLLRRRTRNHAQGFDLGKVRREGVGNTVGEIFLFGVSREVFKRQHHDRSDHHWNCVKRRRLPLTPGVYRKPGG
jgi:hypothetical protein